MNNQTIQGALSDAQEKIDRLDAQILLSFILNKPKSFLITWPEHPLNINQIAIYEAWVMRRKQGYPVAYLTGVQSFWDMELQVNSHVLIPRPETELLVEIAVAKLSFSATVLELATGSGAIACALARERPDLKIIASDISQEALKIAKYNALKYDLKNITFLHSDWFDNIPAQEFDMIVSNPPYLSETDPHLSGDIRFEPRIALVSGLEGDEAYRLILQQSLHYLKNSGLILFEHGADQGPRIRDLFQENGYHQISTQQDLAGLDRVTLGTAQKVF